jgi:hypothetical protein
MLLKPGRARSGEITLYQVRLRPGQFARRYPRCLLLRRRRFSADITQSARTDPIDLPALIVAVIVIVPERVAKSEALEATMMREPPAGTHEAMTAEPAAQAAEMSGTQRPTEVRAGTQMPAADPATKAATTHPAQVSPAQAAAEMATTHPTAEMPTTHSTAEMTTASATTTATATAAARPCVGRDAGASHRYGHRDHRDFVQREYPHDISFRSDDFDSRRPNGPLMRGGATPTQETYRSSRQTFA